MQYIVICSLALFASGLTLFSGFGLGTLLLPAFLMFFPADLAVAMTAVVHFANNIFKLVLVGKHTNWRVVLRFGIPAALAAFVGAQVLLLASAMDPLASYMFLGKTAIITPVKIVMAILILAFAAYEMLPASKHLSVSRNVLPLGGLLSGFFGGLSGHQGALRSAFLIHVGLSKEAFIATGVVIACLVDVSRLSIYGSHLASIGVGANGALIISATVSAFLGAYVGNRLLKKVTMRTVEIIVSALLFFIAAALGCGIV